MTTAGKILEWFENFAPLDSAMDFDNVGLLVGDGNAPVASALLALDITPSVVEEAERLGCGLIISHHPVIFSPLKRVDSRSVPYMLAQRGIAAVCMHTNLDLSESFGVNTCLAKAVGVREPQKSPLGECLFIGELEHAIGIAEFALTVKNALGCEGLRYTNAKPTVRVVAVSSGAGGSEIYAAAEAGADVLVTGEIKHHELNFANEAGVSVIDAGHFKSEDIVISPLQKYLSAAFPDTKFTKSSTYGDRIKYI